MASQEVINKNKAKNWLGAKIKKKAFALLHPEEDKEAEKAEAEALRPPEFAKMMAEDGGWRYELETWARNNYRGENFNFLRDVEAYRALAPPTAAALVQIVDQYFMPNASEPVTIDDDQITQPLINARNHPPNPVPQNVFDAAYGAIMNHNAPDSWRAFLAQRNT